MLATVRSVAVRASRAESAEDGVARLAEQQLLVDVDRTFRYHLVTKIFDELDNEVGYKHVGSWILRSLQRGGKMTKSLCVKVFAIVAEFCDKSSKYQRFIVYEEVCRGILK